MNEFVAKEQNKWDECEVSCEHHDKHRKNLTSVKTSWQKHMDQTWDELAI